MPVDSRRSVVRCKVLVWSRAKGLKSLAGVLLQGTQSSLLSQGSTDSLGSVEASRELSKETEFAPGLAKQAH